MPVWAGLKIKTKSKAGAKINTANQATHSLELWGSHRLRAPGQVPKLFDTDPPYSHLDSKVLSVGGFKLNDCSWLQLKYLYYHDYSGSAFGIMTPLTGYGRYCLLNSLARGTDSAQLNCSFITSTSPKGSLAQDESLSQSVRANTRFHSQDSFSVSADV